MEPVHVLQVTTHLGTGGVQSFLVNNARYIDTSKLIFDYAVQTDEVQRYEDEVKEYGSHIYATRSMVSNPIGYFKDIYRICRDHKEIQIVHSHMNYRNFLPLIAAKLAGVRTRISHSHNTYDAASPLKSIARKLYQTALPLFATDYWGCADKANEWLYGSKGKEAKCIHNAIKTEKYFFSAEKRRSKRESLGLNDENTVLIHVGTFTIAKNHDFLVRMFEEYHKKHNNARLILCGDGEKRNEITENIRTRKLWDAVLMLGMVSNVPDLLSAADAFVFPSLYEGAPISVIEAQANGLPCVVSSAVPDDVVFLDNCKKCYDFDADEWCAAIDDVISMGTDRKSGMAATKLAGFDIATEAKQMEELYLAYVEKEK